ncbi:endospore germination permease [Pontibacillus yanchengensis]|nr:endospore germination permease [Pontibacillus yanchengensis]
MRNEPISFLQLVFLIMMSTGFYNHVILSAIINEGGRGAWIGALMSLIPITIFLSIIYFIQVKTKNKSIVSYFEVCFGKIGSKFLLLPIIIYFLLQAYITFFDTITWTNVSYLPNTPELVLSISSILVIGLFLKGGIQSITIISGILLPVVVILGLFVSFSNMPNKNYSLLFPPFINGWDPILKSFFYSLSGSVDLIILFFLQDKLKQKASYWKYLIIGLLLTNLLLAPITGGIALFGPEINSQLRYPAYEQWRVVTIGNYISHVDYLTIYQWLSGAVVRIALMIILIPELFAIKKAKTKSKVHLAILIGLVLSLLLPISDIDFYTFIKELFLPVMIICMSIYFFIFVAVVTWVNRRQKI